MNGLLPVGVELFDARQRRFQCSIGGSNQLHNRVHVIPREFLRIDRFFNYGLIVSARANAGESSLHSKANWLSKYVQLREGIYQFWCVIKEIIIERNQCDYEWSAGLRPWVFERLQPDGIQPVSVQIRLDLNGQTAGAKFSIGYGHRLLRLSHIGRHCYRHADRYDRTDCLNPSRRRRRPDIAIGSNQYRCRNGNAAQHNRAKQNRVVSILHRVPHQLIRPRSLPHGAGAAQHAHAVRSFQEV